MLIFSLVLITEDKPLQPALHENLQLCDREVYQNEKSLLSREQSSARGKEIEIHKRQRRFSYSSTRGEEERRI